MKRNLMLATLTLVTTLGATAFAQPHGSSAPTPQGKQNRAYVPEVTERRDDRWDLKQLQSLQDRFIATQKLRRSNHREVAAIDQQLRTYLSAELREGRMEVVSASSQAKNPNGWRDTREDYRVAQADLRAESRSLKRLRGIDAELNKVYGRYDRYSMTARNRLIGELVTLAKAEVRTQVARR